AKTQEERGPLPRRRGPRSCGRDQPVTWTRPDRRSVGVLTLEVLERPADESRHADDGADGEDPPAHRDAEEEQSRGKSQHQRPPGVRTEEAVVTLILLDVAAGVILRGRVEAAVRDVQVERDEEEEEPREQQGHHAGRLETV